MKLHLLAWFMLLLCAQPVSAQYYTLLTVQEPYTELTGATIITNTLAASTYAVNIGSGVKVFNQVLGSTLQVGKNGFTVSTGASYSFALDPFLANLKYKDSSTSISWQTDNSDPANPVIKFQWKNIGLTGHPASDYVNFQLWIHKTSQEVSFRYGPSQVTDTLAFGTGKGPQAIIALLSKDFVQGYESHTLTGNAAAAVDDTDAASTGSLIGVPLNGTAYRFMKRAAVGITQPMPGTNAKLYPNPVTNRLRIETNEWPDRIRIWDAQGKLWMEFNTGAPGEIAVSDLPQGIYILELLMPDTSHQHIRFVKK